MAPTHPSRFFKPLLPGFHQGLLIPVDFSKHLSLSNNKDDEADGVLRTECGKWNVKIKGGRFDDGWSEFAKHHDLRVGDFVVFKHHGDLVFYVSVYGPNACKRRYYSNKCVKPEPDMPLPNNTNHSSVCPEEGASSPAHPSFQATLHAYNIQRSEFYIPVKFGRLHGLCNRHCKMMTIKNDDHHEQRSWQVMMHHSTQNRVYLSNGWTEFRVANALNLGDNISFTLTENGKTPVMVFNKVKETSDSMENKANEVDARTFTSVMTPSIVHHSVLYIPTKFVKSNNLTESCQVTITDPEQRQWVVKANCSKVDGSVRFHQGWRNVALANKLKVRDVIQFELVKRGEKTFAMNMSILGKSFGRR